MQYCSWVVQRKMNSFAAVQLFVRYLREQRSGRGWSKNWPFSKLSRVVFAYDWGTPNWSLLLTPANQYNGQKTAACWNQTNHESQFEISVNKQYVLLWLRNQCRIIDMHVTVKKVLPHPTNSLAPGASHCPYYGLQKPRVTMKNNAKIHKKHLALGAGNQKFFPERRGHEVTTFYLWLSSQESTEVLA